MITVWGGQTSRSLRVVWLLEEMGLAYRVRQVDMLSADEDAEFLAINPAVYIPVLQDGDVTLVESVAMLEYLMARYGPTPLSVKPDDPAFAAYQQFLHLGEAGLATLMMPAIVSRFLAPEAERRNWGASWAQDAAQRRLKLVRRQLRPERRRTGLPRPHHGTRRLQAGPGEVPTRAGSVLGPRRPPVPALRLDQGSHQAPTAWTATKLHV